jgi:hypothetical protein
MLDNRIGRVAQTRAAGHAALDEIPVAARRQRGIKAADRRKQLPGDEQVRGGRLTHGDEPLLVKQRGINDRPRRGRAGKDRVHRSGHEIGGLQRRQSGLEPTGTRQTVGVDEGQHRAPGQLDTAVAADVGVLAPAARHAQPLAEGLGRLNRGPPGPVVGYHHLEAVSRQGLSGEALHQRLQPGRVVTHRDHHRDLDLFRGQWLSDGRGGGLTDLYPQPDSNR